jgi:hypothetical protein
LIGTYDGHQMEIGAGLKLKAEGRFEYVLAYGALDEHAEGHWAERGGKVLLTTEPVPKPPHFALVSDAPSADGKLHAALDKPDALGGFTLTLRLWYPGADKPVFVEAGEDGTVTLPPGPYPISIIPDLPVYDAPLKPYPLKPGGRRMVFRFEPNDIGVADFRDEPLAIDKGALVMRRFDRTLHFRKVTE